MPCKKTEEENRDYLQKLWGWVKTSPWREKESRGEKCEEYLDLENNPEVSGRQLEIISYSSPARAPKQTNAKHNWNAMQRPGLHCNAKQECNAKACTSGQHNSLIECTHLTNALLECTAKQCMGQLQSEWSWVNAEQVLWCSAKSRECSLAFAEFQAEERLNTKPG